ncbi:MAG: hypothetical protein JJE52_11575 [Acidimicrobiia bacterium]|nr:hypothetical protein [Acidimicrobiia bacterium]
MSRPAQTFTFDGTDLAAVVDTMGALVDARAGWINVTPAEAEPAPPTSVWGRISGRGPDVPRITWTAPAERRGKVEPAQLGIEHPAGGKSVQQLAEAGLPLPAGWLRSQDHPMRGLVVVPATDAEPGDVLRWALDAVEVLTGWPADGRWRAQVFGTD